MKATFKNKIQKLVAGFLLISVGLLVVNNVVFIHAHKLSNGEVLVHAHPYNKSQDPAPFKKHDHSSKELFHIAHFQLLFFIAVFSIFSIILTGLRNIYFYNTPAIRFNCYLSLKGRAPPMSYTPYSFPFNSCP